MSNQDKPTQPAATEGRDIHEAYVRLTMEEDLEIVIGINDRRLQQTFRDDLKRLAVEWMEQIKAPTPAPKSWESARVEFVTQDSLDREQQMRQTLEWILHHTEVNDAIYARVRQVLGQHPGLPF